MDKIIICTKCGRSTDDTPKQKYCGDGSDKDNSHRYKEVSQEEFKKIRENKALKYERKCLLCN